MLPLHLLVCTGGHSHDSKQGLMDYLVRECNFGVVGPQSGLASNKLIRVYSSLDLGIEGKDTCRCGAEGREHYEEIARSIRRCARWSQSTIQCASCS